MSFRTCCHIKSDGLKCDSPALNRQSYCYFHYRWKKRQQRRLQLGGPVGTNRNCGIEMPILEGYEEIQVGIMEVLEALIDDRIDTKRAGLMLYALQLASTNTRMMEAPGLPQPESLTDLTEEEILAGAVNLPPEPSEALSTNDDGKADGAPHLPQSADVGSTTAPALPSFRPESPGVVAEEPVVLSTTTNPDSNATAPNGLSSRAMSPRDTSEGPAVLSTPPQLSTPTTPLPRESSRAEEPVVLSTTPNPDSNTTDQPRESSPARQCGEHDAEQDPSRADARRQIDNDDTRLYYKPTDTYEQMMKINERRILAGKAYDDRNLAGRSA